MARKGQDVEAAERRPKAVRLRVLGWSYPRIGRYLGVSQVTAYHDVQHGLRAYREELKDAAADLVALELERLEMPMRRLARTIRAKDTPPDQLYKALEQWRKYSESRRKLLGLDAPEKIAPTDPSGEQEYQGLSDERIADYLLGVLESREHLGHRQEPDARGEDGADAAAEE